VLTAEQRAAVAARLEAAYRHRDAQSLSERREEHTTAAAARAALEEQLASARAESVAAIQAAEAANAARMEAESVSEDLRGQVVAASPRSPARTSCNTAAPLFAFAHIAHAALLYTALPACHCRLHLPQSTRV